MSSEERKALQEKISLTLVETAISASAGTPSAMKNLDAWVLRNLKNST